MDVNIGSLNETIDYFTYIDMRSYFLKLVGLTKSDKYLLNLSTHKLVYQIVYNEHCSITKKPQKIIIKNMYIY